RQAPRSALPAPAGRAARSRSAASAGSSSGPGARARWARRPRRASASCATEREPVGRKASASRSRGREGRRPRRVEVFPDPAGELAGVAGADGLQLRGDAVARPDLDLALLHAGLEAVERAHRRAADPLALEVVDAAVARADEVAGG